MEKEESYTQFRPKSLSMGSDRKKKREKGEERNKDGILAESKTVVPEMREEETKNYNKIEKQNKIFKK